MAVTMFMDKQKRVKAIEITDWVQTFLYAAIPALTIMGADQSVLDKLKELGGGGHKRHEIGMMEDVHPFEDLSDMVKRLLTPKAAEIQASDSVNGHESGAPDFQKNAIKVALTGINTHLKKTGSKPVSDEMINTVADKLRDDNKLNAQTQALLKSLISDMLPEHRDLTNAIDRVRNPGIHAHMDTLAAQKGTSKPAGSILMMNRNS